jgi:Fic family protein
MRSALASYNTLLKTYHKLGGKEFDLQDINNSIINATYHSNAIEGNTFTYDETYSFLKTGKVIPNHDYTEHAEIQDLARAHKLLERFVKEKVPLSEGMILALHNEVLRSSNPTKAGKYKTTSNRVGNYTTPYPSKAKELFSKAIESFQKKEAKLHPLQLAAEFHHDLVVIHPFADGNGRVARLIINYVLLKNNQPFLNITIDEKPEYFKAIVNARESGSYEPFTKFLVDIAAKKLKARIQYLADNPQKKSPGDSAGEFNLLKEFKPEKIEF